MNWTLLTILISIDLFLLGVLIMCVINFDKLIQFWMKRITILVILLLPLPVFAAGTWNHRQVKTLNDGSVLVEFTRQTTGEVRLVHFSRVIGNGSEQLNRKKWNLEVAWSVLNSFDLGENSKEILVKLIKAIRNNSALTVTQATNWYDTNYPDAMWKGIELLKRMQAKVEEETGVTVTWTQFKTYVQNHIFEGVDNYVP